MKKLHYFLLLAILMALLIPASVSAAGTFYCSTSLTVDGDGSYANPWACPDATELDKVVNDYICDTYFGGYLYEIYPDSYRYHVVTYYSTDDCRVTSTLDYAGLPPSTGVNVPSPYIIGSITLLGLGLIGGGIYLRRKRSSISA